jgi:hypothetical protein
MAAGQTDRYLNVMVVEPHSTHPQLIASRLSQNSKAFTRPF